MKLYPAVKKINLTGKDVCFSNGIFFKHNKETKKVKQFIPFPCEEHREDCNENLFFNVDTTLGHEAYRIVIVEEKIEVFYHKVNGLFYALKTLYQIFRKDKKCVPALELFDEPDLAFRGFMLDISRNKIPTLNTLKSYVDILSDLKYNHFELYVEGFSYEYPSFKELYDETMTPLTPKEFKKLEKYAKERMIDLVPCHNGLGHMTAWLKHYPELAIMPKGMFFWGAHRDPSTINPLDPKSLELVKTFYQDAINDSSSKFFHMNLDEPYELGHGKTKDVASKIGVGQMYLDYVLKLYDFVKNNKKTPLIWGDVLNHYPEMIEKLPKDLIFVDWGYDYDYPFYQTLKRLGNLNVKFVAAPGTSTWNSITGRTTTMIENIRQACLHTKENNGLGMLLTEWGDNGHLQPFVVSLPAIVYGGLESWHARLHNIKEIREFIDQIILNEPVDRTGKLIMNLGRYTDEEPTYTYNGTKLFDVIRFAQNADLEHLQESFFDQFHHHPIGHKDVFDRMMENIGLMEVHYKRIRPRYKSGVLYKAEINLAIRMLKALLLMMHSQHGDCRNLEYLDEKKWLFEQYPKILKDFEKIWLARNKKGGLEESMKPLRVLGEFINEIQNYNFIERNRRHLKSLKHYQKKFTNMN